MLDSARSRASRTTVPIDSVRVPQWRLTIYLELGARRRTVTLDYLEREPISAQAWQFDRTSLDPYRLIDLTNEAGESLAFVWCAYKRHEIAALC